MNSKSLIAILAVAAILSVGTMAYAFGGYGYGMMGPGYYGMMGPGFTGNNAETQAYLDKTTAIRKELSEKQFDYVEAVRSGDQTKADKLAKEIETLSEKLAKEAPQQTQYAGWRMPCW